MRKSLYALLALCVAGRAPLAPARPIPTEADPLHRRLSAGRHERHRRARSSRQKMTEQLGPAGHRREPPRRERQHRHRDRRARAARRLHDHAERAADTHAIPRCMKLTWIRMRDFAPSRLVAVVAEPARRASVASAAKRVKELIAHLEKRTRASSPSARRGSARRCTCRWSFSSTLTGTKLVHVPYKGSAGVLVDADWRRRSQLDSDNIPRSSAQARDGKIRALAVSAPKRAPAAPEIPTVAEAGVPGFEALSWFGLLAPAKTPRRHRDEAFRRDRSASSSFRTCASASSPSGAQPVGGTPQEYAAFIQSEIAKWEKVIRDAGVKAE